MVISNISFIVIAKNEEFGVDRCLGRLGALTLQDCQVICVDSGSTDGTLDVMRSYQGSLPDLTIIKCTGFVNASVARNAGLPHADRDFVFFVDGDVELSADFIAAALERLNDDRADAVTGRLDEIQYTPDYKTTLRELVRRRHITREAPAVMTGGIFITRRALVRALAPWDTRMWRLQDFEYTLRMTRLGRLVQLPMSMGIHHTQEYHDRSWEHFLRGYPRLYGHLIYQNLDRPAVVWALFRGNRGLLSFTLILLTLIVLAACGLAGLMPLWWAGAAGALLVALDALYSLGRKGDLLRNWIRHGYLEPPGVFCGIFRGPGNPSTEKVSTIIKLQ